jgi:hypothetical protein
MKIVHASRAMGKTDALIKNFIAHPGRNKMYIVSRYAEKRMVQLELSRLGYQELQDLVFTVDAIRIGKHYGRFTPSPYVAVDNIDNVLQDLLEMHVDVGTIS